MPDAACETIFENWLSIVRNYVTDNDPELLLFLDVYIGEARFGRQFIATDLINLPPDAALLEVGAGSLLLSCQLVREGFKVTALEPIGSGFSHFERLRELVLNRAHIHNCMPEILNQSVEELTKSNCYDYAFSINVMEHVKDPALSIAKIGSSLRRCAIYRFTCANYLFPYEPHFNIPTLFSKHLTEIVFKRHIANTRLMPDPEGTWKSLNWIDVISISKLIKRMPDLTVTYNRNILFAALERITIDSEFAGRRSRLITVLITTLVKLRLHYLFRIIPVSFQPIIDCQVTRIL